MILNFARIGGEEFAILLYDVPLEDARVVAEEVCDTVAAYDFSDKEQLIDVTVSIGVASTGESVDSLEALHHEADQRLYEAKACGRNCIR